MLINYMAVRYGLMTGVYVLTRQLHSLIVPTKLKQIVMMVKVLFIAFHQMPPHLYDNTF